MSPYNVGKITLMITESNATDIPEDWFKKENYGLGGAQFAVIRDDAQFTEDEQQIEIRLSQNDYNITVEEKDQEGGAIKVTRLPPGTSEEQIILFFENRRKIGGGEVEKVEYDEDSNCAVVWFKDSDVVSSVLQKAPLLFNKKQIYVEQGKMDGKKVEKEAEENTGTLCTIEVRGMKETTSIDSVELYFDNKRKSGGGGVEEVKGEVEDGVLYVTFEDEKIVERVLQQEHRVDGATLQVKIYQPPKPVPMYQDRVLIKGFNPETTKEGLVNFLEAKSRDDVKDVIYGQEQGTAIVSFWELRDFGKLEAACQMNALQKHYLSVRRVPISNCVIVSGFGESTSVDTLEFYFDNKKRSGGGGVKEAIINSEDRTCLVYFEDPAACDRVCRKSHKVDNQMLTVHTYHKCLGQTFNPNEGPTFKPLDPVIMRELDLRKMKFVYTSDEFQQAMNKQAELSHSRIKWQKRAATELTVECTLTKDVKNCQKLAGKWKKQVADGIKKLLGALHVQPIIVLHEAWEKCLEGIKQVNLPDPQKVGIFIEKGNHTIVIVGYNNTVEVVKNEVEKIIATEVDEIQRRKQQVIETVQLKHHQYLLLISDHFKKETEKKFPNLKVRINTMDKSFIFEGQYLEVSQAKMLLLEKCLKICQASTGRFSKNRQEFLRRRDVNARIEKLLNEKTNMSCFDFQREEIIIYAFSDDKAVEAAQLIKDSIVESPIDVQPDSAFLLNSGAWDKKIREIAEIFEGFLQLITLPEQKKVIIVTLKEYVGLAREFLEDFLRDNTIMYDSIDLPPSYLRFFELHQTKKFEQIGANLKEQQVQITQSKNRITIKGTKIGLDQAKGRIKDMLKKIHSKKHTIKRPGIANYIQSEAGKKRIIGVQKFHKCYIQIGDKDATGFSCSEQKQSSNSEIAEHRTKAGVKNHWGLAGTIDKKGGKQDRRESWKPVFADKPEDQSSAFIVVYADSEKDIDAAIKKLESLLDADFTTKYYSDPLIRHLTQGQVNTLHNLKEEFNIDVAVDKEKGVVTLYGRNEALLEASGQVHGLLRDADRRKQAQLEAELLSDIVHWYFIENLHGQYELVEYPNQISQLVEKAYHNKQPDVKFTDQAGTEYTINFNNMEEFPSGDPTDVITVTRRDRIKDSTFEPPPEWSLMKDSENLVVVMVQNGSPEYIRVIDRFQQDVGYRKIFKLERIQNKMLYQQYVAKKKLLDTQNPSGTQNERELWHGTAPGAVNSINSLGFNRSYCGKNAIAFGEGVYFAVSAGYSASNTYSRPDPSGNKRMYLCKVLTGEFTQGRTGLRVPPSRAGQQSHILYDSVVDRVQSPGMFIIFNDIQAYPCYIITFK
ncbi:uncharacterized protein LOC134281522 [Saccostrea cucullata]|uniref:uncharacterized protein LOC134281522 n=1 Tax=Saccostrea cuccullata TaxID=36930 RepID=UPI002ED61A43